METFSVTSSSTLTACFTVSTVMVAALPLSASIAVAVVTHIVSITAKERNSDSKRFLLFMFFRSFRYKNVLYHRIHELNTPSAGE